jgi:hypothetical protein
MGLQLPPVGSLESERCLQLEVVSARTATSTRAPRARRAIATTRATNRLNICAPGHSGASHIPLTNASLL